MTRENTPLRRSLGHKLGTALYMAGDVAGATAQFRQVIEASPSSGIDESAAKAHYSLGVLLASSGRANEALEHLTSAVTYQPTYVEARLALGDILRQVGRPQSALAHYKEAAAVNPRSVQAQLGYALALIDLHRYQDARAWLSEAVERTRPYAERVGLAVNLAAAPERQIPVQADARRIGQVLTNLLANAVKFCRLHVNTPYHRLLRGMSANSSDDLCRHGSSPQQAIARPFPLDPASPTDKSMDSFSWLCGSSIRSVLRRRATVFGQRLSARGRQRRLPFSQIDN